MSTMPCAPSACSAVWHGVVLCSHLSSAARARARGCAQVRVELAPWEKRIGEVDGRISVVASERDVLSKKVRGRGRLPSSICTGGRAVEEWRP